MILRQLFDRDSYTYSYLVGDEKTRIALIIDPVLDQVQRYLQLLDELGLALRAAIDTHVHADHITALGDLRKLTGCDTYLGNRGDIECADQGLVDGQVIAIGDLSLKVLFTPGHTDDSYCFYIEHQARRYLFTGDTLLIRGSGRTDFQNGDPKALYESLHNIVLAFPDDTVVYPGHDYKGWTRSTIAEEKAHNPRLKLPSKAAFVAHMNSLKLPDPKWMDLAVPANRGCGKV